MAAESRGPQAASDVIAATDPEPSKVSTDLRVIVELRCATPVRVALVEHAGV